MGCQDIGIRDHPKWRVGFWQYPWQGRGSSYHLRLPWGTGHQLLQQCVRVDECLQDSG